MKVYDAHFKVLNKAISSMKLNTFNEQLKDVGREIMVRIYKYNLFAYIEKLSVFCVSIETLISGVIVDSLLI